MVRPLKPAEDDPGKTSCISEKPTAVCLSCGFQKKNLRFVIIGPQNGNQLEDAEGANAGTFSLSQKNSENSYPLRNWKRESFQTSRTPLSPPPSPVEIFEQEIFPHNSKETKLYSARRSVMGQKKLHRPCHVLLQRSMKQVNFFFPHDSNSNATFLYCQKHS